MDPLSITLACISLTTAAAKTTVAVQGFVRTFRESRQDLAAVTRQLGELNMIIDLLKDESNTADDQQTQMPDSLKSQICGMLASCAGVLAELDVIVEKHKSGSFGSAARWTLRGKEEVAALQKRLSEHIAALNIALEVSIMSVFNTLPLFAWDVPQLIKPASRSPDTRCQG